MYFLKKQNKQKVNMVPKEQNWEGKVSGASHNIVNQLFFNKNFKKWGLDATYTYSGLFFSTRAPSNLTSIK